MFQDPAGLLIFLFLAGLLSGVMNAIMGGGGLITVPCLLIAGVPPLETLGTQKLQNLLGHVSSIAVYHKGGHVHWRRIVPAAIMTAFAGLSGALLTILLPLDVIARYVPFVLIILTAILLARPALREPDTQRPLSGAMMSFAFVPAVGFYDGMFGPGSTVVLVYGLVALAGLSIVRSIAHANCLNFSSSIFAFLVFCHFGTVNWHLGLLMGFGQIIGAQAGSRLAMKRGARVIKPMLALITFGLAMKLINDPINPVQLWFKELF